MDKALDEQERLQMDPLIPQEPPMIPENQVLSEDEKIHRKMIERMERAYVDSSYI